MEYKHIHLSWKNEIAQVVIDNPKTLNALDVEVMNELSDAFMYCEKNGDIKAIILSGAGRAFSGGGDISTFCRDAEKGTTDLEPLTAVLSEVTLQMKKCPKPIIAAVHGAAAGGGCNLALACDVVIASDDAKFVQAFIKIALVPDTGGAFWLPRLVGTMRAFEMLATGRHVKADEAYRIGMITEVCPRDQLLERAMEYARIFADGPTVAIGNTKRLMFDSMYKDFEKFIESEVKYQVDCSKTEDYVEGIMAFRDKRKPDFKGK